MRKEESLQLEVCRYISLQYKDVMFISDVASGVKLNTGQAVRASKMRSSRGWPDLFIPEPRGLCYGLFIELKTIEKSPYLKDGRTLKSDPHILEQAEMIEKLNKRGYYARFAVGFDQAKHIIDKYFSMPAGGQFDTAW